MTGICLDGLRDGADAGQIDRAAEALLARAAMDKNGRDARVFQHPRQVRRGQILLVPSQPHFGGDRNFHGVHHAADQLRGLLQFRHHGGASADAADFSHRAAHVDVNRGNADGLEIDGGVAHLFGDGAKQLHGQRTVRRAGFDQLERLGFFFQERAGVDQIGGGQVQSAQFAHGQAEGQVGVTRQGREEQIGLQLERADAHPGH